MYKKFLLLAAFFLCTVSARAQWSTGISAGWDYNWPSVTKGYATDVNYRGQSGFDVDLIGKYSFLNWLAVRADLRLDSRGYKMERNYYRVQEVYTNHRDIYLHLPIVADFSFGGQKLRGHCYLGGYVGYWLSALRDGNSIQNTTTTEASKVTVTPFSERMEFDSRRDNRFNAGLTGGVGISYLVASHWEIFAEALCLYDLTASNKSAMLANPRYNSTMCVNLGVMYNF